MGANSESEKRRPDALKQSLVRGYLDHLTRERRLSAHTTSNYARDIAALLQSSFFDVWAHAGIAEILSALHERVVTAGRS